MSQSIATAQTKFLSWYEVEILYRIFFCSDCDLIYKIKLRKCLSDCCLIVKLLFVSHHIESLTFEVMINIENEP